MNALPSLLLELLKNFRIFAQMVLFDANFQTTKAKNPVEVGAISRQRYRRSSRHRLLLEPLG